jgi:hypothetical protein
MMIKPKNRDTIPPSGGTKKIKSKKLKILASRSFGFIIKNWGFWFLKFRIWFLKAFYCIFFLLVAVLQSMKAIAAKNNAPNK